MPKKKGNKTEAKAVAKSAPRPAGEGEPKRVEQAAEENESGLGTGLGPEPLAQLSEDKGDQAAGQQEQQTQQQQTQQQQQQPQLQQHEKEQEMEKGQEQKQQEEPGSLQPTTEETAEAQATCDPEQVTSGEPTELLTLLKELGEADPDSLLGSEEVPANLVTELLQNGNLLEQLAQTADELDVLSKKFMDMGEKVATEHRQFEERLQSAEEQARNEALEAAQRRDKFQQLQLDCEALVTQLMQAQEKFAPAIGAATSDAGEIEATPFAGNIPDAVEDATQADAPEEFEDASGQSQEDEPRQEFAEARDGPEYDEDESSLNNAEKKGWLGGWFKK